jgi:glycosyltransferase involved in cell wall biosynthesis
MDEIRRIRSMRNLRGLEGWFTVVIPAFNRADTLPKALESLLSQRYEKWLAVVLDDGSTDRTPLLMSEWQERDPRIFYCRYEENLGGVARNEIGMAMACEQSEFWSRLGSDDWWGPGKLESDAAALAAHEAAFGAFTVWRHGKPAEICAGSWGPSQGVSPSERLRRGEFLASWANVAARTSVLRRVRERWGNFVDPSLRNMEDSLFNSRVAFLGVEWVWRPGDPNDAFWNCLEAVGADPSASASANAEVTGRDNAITQKLIAAMRSGQ